MFLTRTGRKVTVMIVTDKDMSRRIDIGAEGGDVLFAEDPVTIEGQASDTFSVSLGTRATVRLLTRRYMAELFCPDCFRAAVSVYRGDRCLFCGFVEPNTYSQDFNAAYDELELSCVDILGSLEYRRYRDTGVTSEAYAKVKQAAAQRTFYDILSSQLRAAYNAAYTTGEAGRMRIYYDGSKTLTAAKSPDILKSLSISELLFLGDDENDVWQQNDVMDEMLRYLDLHIAQTGQDFYIFSWQSVRQCAGTPVTWTDLESGDTVTEQGARLTITPEAVADDGTQVDVGEVYSRLSLSCEIKKTEDIIDSPLDNALVTPAFPSKQLYMREVMAEGEGVKAFRTFWDITHSRTPDAGDASAVKAKTVDWHIQLMRNDRWSFCLNGANSLPDYYLTGSHQEAYPNALGDATRSIGAALISVGSVKNEPDQSDDSPNDKAAMTNYLFIAVNGNGKDGEAEALPGDSQIKGGIPCAAYEGARSGGVLSPSDDGTTNYIVFSGSMVLNPLTRVTGEMADLMSGDNDFWAEEWRNGSVVETSGLGQPTGTVRYSTFWHKTVPSRNNGDGRYYTRRLFACLRPPRTGLTEIYERGCLMPFTDENTQEYKYSYSQVGDGTDKIKKLPLIQCMLIIGDKCLVEEGHSGMPDDFVWRAYKTREQCAGDDEYYQQSFSLGVNPKIGDYIVGQKYDMQDNNYDLGIDAEGTCIPIRRGDRVSGQVRFLILGPVNSYWDDITRRHPTFFRHTKWTAKAVPVLAHTSSIIIEKFECKVYSDNGLINSGQDNDLVYMSDTDETFINEKDDLTFKINSALTSAEAYELGVPLSVSLSTPLDAGTGNGALAITDQTTARTAKPEQLYVDAYYREYHEPRPQLTQNFQDTGDADRLLLSVTHPAMEGRSFYPLTYSRSVIDDEIEVTLRDNELTDNQ